MDRLVIVIPANLRVRSSNHYAVQPCSLALGNLEVCRRFVEDRLDKDFRGDVCSVVISPTVSLWIRLSANQRRKQFNQSEQISQPAHHVTIYRGPRDSPEGRAVISGGTRIYNTLVQQSLCARNELDQSSCFHRTPAFDWWTVETDQNEFFTLLAKDEKKKMKNSFRLQPKKVKSSKYGHFRRQKRNRNLVGL